MNIKIKTQFINSAIETGTFDIWVTAEADEQLKRLNLDLVDISQVLITGRVTKAESYNDLGFWNPTGHWQMQGMSIDDHQLELDFIVNKADSEIELLSISSIDNKKGTSHAKLTS